LEGGETNQAEETLFANRRPIVKFLPRAAVTVLLLLSGQPLKSNIFGDIASSFQRRQQAIGAGIGKAVGVKLGGVLETATAPALDNAASTFTKVVNGAADKLDQSLQAENESIDSIAKRNVDRIDVLTQTRLSQVDTLIGADLKKINADANSLLNREAQIINNALTQENTIANNALDRVETISDQTLTRLQGIESDAFDRIDSALQDEVPVAASEVAHEFVIAALVVVCIVALFGFAGISLWKNLQQAKESGSGMSQILKNGFANFWRTLPQEAAVVVIPTVLIAAAILAGYEGYLRSTRAMRVSRLEKAAGLLESAGDYKVASELRGRLLSIDGGNDSNHQQFWYQADLWLADFTQKHSVAESDLMARLALLENNNLGKANGDLQAASLYLKANTEGNFDGAAAKRYTETVLAGKTASQAPFLGKLVLMTQIKAELDHAAPASERVESALKITQRLRTLYPNYANGHILAAALSAMQADAVANGETSNLNREAALRTSVSDELTRAASLDPELMRIIRLAHSELPADVLKDLDENPRTPNLAARLSAFASNNIDPLARAVLGSDVLTHLAVDRTVLHAARLGVGERRVARAIAALPASAAKPEQRASAMALIAQQFLDMNSYLAAESWAQSAKKALAGAKNADAALSSRIDTIGQAAAQAKISEDLAAVI
jgi:hypothetical protein